MNRPSIAVGVMAYNEEGNIGLLLESLLSQTVGEDITRIIVIASGCTDRTCEIVATYCGKDSRVELVAEKGRSGKISAINHFMTMVTEPIVVVSCGDLIFEPTTVENLCRPFEESRVGMTGAHPMPVNASKSFAAFAVQLMWELHHRVAMQHPKMGELVAFRNILSPLDPRALCDEISIEKQIRDAGLDIVYAPNATVRNQGPQTLRDFFRQRCRWIAANYQVMSDYDACVSTMKPRLVLAATRDLLRERALPYHWLASVACIEVVARIRAFIDYHILRSRQKYRVWTPIESTKVVVETTSNEGEREHIAV
jgi:poly-beta-1,6-N-acetyl-D-glucosamine synthase